MSLSKKKCLLAGVAAAVLLPVLRLQNNGLRLTKCTLKTPRLPSGFDGCRLLHLSDLHNKEFGHGQSKLLYLSQEASPDYILITGDLINDGRAMENALCYARKAVRIAPVYFVPGNHEKGSGRYQELSEALTAAGVHVLHNRAVLLERNGSSAALIGLADPRFFGMEPMDSLLRHSFGFERMDAVIHNQFETALALLRKEDAYSILLTHRPELFEIYVRQRVELAFAGHAHGGQFRLPGLGGLIAPGQGLFPAYSAGLYHKGTTTMVVSRGLGNSRLKLRLNNRPELVLITLRRSGKPSGDTHPTPMQ